MNDAGPLAIERELRRIGVDTKSLAGLVSSGGITAADVLAWLRSLPTGLGHAAFLEQSRTAGPQPGCAAKGMPARDQSFATPDLDALQAFRLEMRRVLPPDLGHDAWAIMKKIDYADAARRLKLLPDRAGWDAVRAVVPVVKVHLTSE